MTSFRSNHRGTLQIDRCFDGIGRIYKASGTHDPETKDQIDAMLTVLYGKPRHDLLRAVRDKLIKPIVLLDYFLRGALDQIPSPDSLAPLATFKTWADTEPTSPENRRSRLKAWRALEELSRQGMTVLELPALLRAYRVAKVGTAPVMFNRVKAAVQAFVRDTLGQRHPLWGQLADVRPLASVPTREPHPLTDAEILEVAATLDPGAAACARAMLVTGMGSKEFWVDGWRQLADRIVIGGTKRRGRRRAVPLVERITAPAIGRGAFEHRLQRAFAGRIQPYDFRRTYANLLLEVGIPTNRRDHYRGHGPKTMGDLYERPQIAQWLVGDAELLRARLAKVKKAAKAKPVRHLRRRA